LSDWRYPGNAPLIRPIESLHKARLGLDWSRKQGLRNGSEGNNPIAGYIK